MKAKQHNTCPARIIDKRKREWAKVGLRDDQVNFLAVLLQTSDEVQAFQASTKDRAGLVGLPARRGANGMLLELYRSHPGLVEQIREETTRLARLKTDLGHNAMLDAEAPEERAAGLAANLRRFSGDGAAQPEEPVDRDPVPVVHADLAVAVRERARG